MVLTLPVDEIGCIRVGSDKAVARESTAVVLPNGFGRSRGSRWVASALKLALCFLCPQPMHAIARSRRSGSPLFGRIIGYDRRLSDLLTMRSQRRLPEPCSLDTPSYEALVRLYPWKCRSSNASLRLAADCD